MPITGIGLGDNPFSGGPGDGSDSSDPDPAGDGIDGSPYPGLQPDFGLGENPFADGGDAVDPDPQGPANQDERPRVDGDTDIDEDDLEDPVDPSEQNVGQFLPLPIPTQQDSGPSTAVVAGVVGVIVAVAAVVAGGD